MGSRVKSVTVFKYLFLFYLLKKSFGGRGVCVKYIFTLICKNVQTTVKCLCAVCSTRPEQ